MNQRGLEKRRRKKERAGEVRGWCLPFLRTGSCARSTAGDSTTGSRRFALSDLLWCSRPDRFSRRPGSSAWITSARLAPPQPKCYSLRLKHIPPCTPANFFFFFFCCFFPLTLCMLSLMTHKGPTKPHQPFVFFPIRASERSPFQTPARQTVSKNNSCSFFILEPEPPRHSFCRREHAAGHRVHVGPTSTMRQELASDLQSDLLSDKG